MNSTYRCGEWGFPRKRINLHHITLHYITEGQLLELTGK